MATAAQHRAKWLHNRAFLATIDDAFADWMATVMFYTALHAVETLFAHDGTHVHGGHGPRNQTLKTYNRYKQVWKHYRPLFDAARTTRYEADANEWIAVQDVKSRLASDLYRVEASVVKLTNQPLELARLWP